MVLWDNAYYTQNDNYALNSRCFEGRRGDSRTVAFDGKVENPWLEAKTKHVPELAVLKTENKLAFESVTFQSTVDGKGSQYLPYQPY